MYWLYLGMVSQLPSYGCRLDVDIFEVTTEPYGRARAVIIILLTVGSI